MIFEPQKFISSLPSSTYKTLRFILYVTLIFFAHITSSIYVEKMYPMPDLDIKPHTKPMMAPAVIISIIS